MPHFASRISMSWIVSLALFSGILGGCVTSETTVTHPDGRYQLYGSGTAGSPYYWVWIPTGANPPAPPPAPGQAEVVKAVVVPVTQTVPYPEGRYQLYGSGTAASPYYWVWIPAGATMSGLPPLPVQPEAVRTASVPATQIVTYPNGRYQLYGSGTAASPYYWVWVPAGSTVPPPPPLPR